MGQAGDNATAREAAVSIVRTLRGAGHVAYFAGGCVRDELLGLEPTDYDVATDATPRRVRSLFDRTAEVGASFGVVLVRLPEATIEVATFRSDGPYSDRRRPDEVTFSDPESDARRRDFTINALFLDPLGAEDAPSIHGHVVDYVGGMADLGARLIRAVGEADQRLAEDHLRALRAVRLASRLGLEIEASTAAAITRHARELAGVSRERIGEEVRRMLAHPSRAVAAGRMEALGLDEPVFGEARGGGGLGTLAGLEAGAPVPTCLAAWAIDRGLALDGSSVARGVARWRDALCLSNAERDEMEAALGVLVRLRGDWDGLGVAGQKRLASGAGFAEGARLLRAMDEGAAAGVEARVAALRGMGPGLAPEALVGGEDLIGMGMDPGPDFKRILDAVYDAQLEGRVVDRDQAMELARSLNV